MTSEQIAELRKTLRSADNAVVLLGEDADDILRLLDEREALLKTLRNVAAGTPSISDIRAAIAKAESP